MMDQGIILCDAKVKPCPFCGREPVVKKDIRYPRPTCAPKEAYEVVCRTFDCPVRDADNMYYFTIEEAVEAWNTRKGEE